jgi:hypothetical protein
MSGLALQPWRPSAEDRRAMLLIALLPLLVAAPALLGILEADPAIYLSGLAVGLREGLFNGTPYIDPNNGYSTQSLGTLSVWQWLNGKVPWWNHYTGIGLPLAAEYQAGAFFPLTFLLLLPYGMAWMQVALQVLAGLGTYGLLRQMGTGRTAATAGALLYAFNGTLAWFAHAPAAPVFGLPWMLWGIERIVVHAHCARPGGWGMLAFGMAMSLLASFPETAYLNGLLALAWAIVRGLQLPRASWRAYALGIVAGGLTGMAIAAPQVYSFLDYMRYAEIGDHGDLFAHSAQPWVSIAHALVAPYLIGPIFAYASSTREWLFHLWGGMGGYVTLALVATALAGFWSRRDAIGWLLFAWCVATLLRTFGFPYLSYAWNLIPGVSMTAFYRYACPSWELAMVLLAARGLDLWLRGDADAGKARIVAAFAGAVGAAGAVATAAYLWPGLTDARGLRNWAVGSILLATLAAAGVVFALGRGARGARTLASLLVAEAIVMFAIPTFSNPRAGRIDMDTVRFLRDNLGFQRFFTLAPFQPNYGAYFRIASINYNVLPNSGKWYRWVADHLDQKAGPTVFNGVQGGGGLEPLRKNLVAYEEIGVRYVLANKDVHPFVPGDPARLAYEGASLDIYELLNAKPYFESATGQCKLAAPSRSLVVADCAAPDRLVRRELFFPGWTATVAGRDAPIEEHLDLYQSVMLPAGRSEVRFDYAPRHVGWAWLACLLGLVLSVGRPLLRRARRWGPRSRSAT